MRAQSLARPGWAGSGLSVEPWWTHAVLYAVDPHRYAESGDLAGLVGKLDYVRSLGVDGITLTHLQGGDGAGLDPRLGSMDDFDTVVREAGRDNLRALVELDSSKASDADGLVKAARFWLGHGAAGVSLSAPVEDAPMRALREAVHGFPGKRIVVAPVRAGSEQRPELTLDSSLKGVKTLDATALRGVLEGLQNAAGKGAVLAESAARQGGGSVEAGKVMAAMLLATRVNAQIAAGEEIGLTADAPMVWGAPAAPGGKKASEGSVDVAMEEVDSGSVLNWYRSLIDLHHGSSALRAGTETFLDHDADHALMWVVRRTQVTPQTPALVVVCNLSDKPVKLNLTADMAALHLRGVFLRTVLRSGTGMGGQSLDAVTLPGYGVFLGELRF